jgi:hypothetical protein
MGAQVMPLFYGVFIIYGRIMINHQNPPSWFFIFSTCPASEQEQKTHVERLHYSRMAVSTVSGVRED